MRKRQAKKIYKKYARWQDIQINTNKDFDDTFTKVEYLTTRNTSWDRELGKHKIGMFDLGKYIYGFGYRNQYIGWDKHELDEPDYRTFGKYKEGIMK
jgi:hypothetical protein